MAKKKVDLKDSPLILIGGLILAFSVMFAGAYFVGEREKVGHAEANRQPVKKLRAKAGTERKNAMALTSSQRSAVEEQAESMGES
jgi:hypothetical protein